MPVRTLPVLVLFVAACKPEAPEAAVLSAPPARKQDEPPKPKPGPNDRVKLAFRAELKQVNDRWTFHIRGETNLPDQTVLNFTVFHPEEHVGRDGPTIIGDYLMLHNYEDQARVENGKFELELYRLRRRPFSIRYWARAEYKREAQDKRVLKEIARTLGDVEDFEKTAEINLDNPEAFEKEQIESAKLLDEDFRQVRKMYRELKDQFDARRARPDAGAWRTFKNGYLDRILKLKDANEARFTLFKCFRERKGKFNLEDLYGELEELADLCEAGLGDEKKLEEIAQRMQHFEASVEDKYEELDLDRPDPEVLKPLLEELERVAREVVAGLEEWNQKGAELKMRVYKVWFKLAADGTRGSKKVHAHTAEVSEAFNRLFDAAEAGRKAEVDSAVKALNKSIADLKEFAGLK